jgi:hypothetical protein
MERRTKNRHVARSVIGILALTGSVGLGAIGIAASIGGAVSAHPGIHSRVVAGSVKAFSNPLKGSTRGWCPGLGNLPCNAVSGNYGTIDIVKASFSNYGGYAASVAGPADHPASYARISGSSDGTLGETTTGCPTPGSENCTGPYTLFGSNGTDSVFPANGFTTSIKIYLDTTWATANQGQLIGWDTSLNNKSGGYLQDQTFDICSTAGGFTITTVFGSGGCSGGSPQVTTSGWYTFTQGFTAAAVGGEVSDNFTAVNSADASVFQQTVDTGHSTATVGGVNYGWFPDEDVLGLPIADSSLSLVG